MMFFVYILYSGPLQKFYTGHTEDIERRLEEHNRGKGNFTSKGIPWEVITIFETASRSEAISLEMQIKKRGISRYLSDKGIPLPEKFGT